MIQTLTYRGRLDGKDGAVVAAAIDEHVNRLIRTRSTVRGVRVVYDSETIDVSLRISGTDRWRISQEARKVASYLLATQRVSYVRPLQPVSEVTEKTRRDLTLAEGRTAQTGVWGRGHRRPQETPAPTEQT